MEKTLWIDVCAFSWSCGPTSASCGVRGSAAHPGGDAYGGAGPEQRCRHHHCHRRHIDSRHDNTVVDGKASNCLQHHRTGTSEGGLSLMSYWFFYLDSNSSLIPFYSHLSSIEVIGMKFCLGRCRNQFVNNLSSLWLLHTGATDSHTTQGEARQHDSSRATDLHPTTQAENAAGSAYLNHHSNDGHPTACTGELMNLFLGNIFFRRLRLGN